MLNVETLKVDNEPMDRADWKKQHSRKAAKHRRWRCFNDTCPTIRFIDGGPHLKEWATKAILCYDKVREIEGMSQA